MSRPAAAEEKPPASPLCTRSTWSAVSISAHSAAGSSRVLPSARPATISVNRRARYSAEGLGKLHQTSPQPCAPSLSSTRTKTAARSVMVPKDVRTGSLIGVRKTCASTRARTGEAIAGQPSVGSAKTSRFPNGSFTVMVRAPHGASSMPGL